MSPAGAPDLLVEARGALLDACDALREHRDAVILIGAQAIYLHTGRAEVALAEATKDSDLAIDTRILGGDPLLEAAMTRAGFYLDPVGQGRQPGAWRNRMGIPVDLMVPEGLVQGGGRRGARIPPHSKEATRRALGLEAAVVDHAPMDVKALAPGDDRHFTINVAGPAALLIAKLHKLYERRNDPGRLNDKDAHDVYRLLIAVPTARIAATMRELKADGLAGSVTLESERYLDELFAQSADALGCEMAGRAEFGIGDPDVVAQSSHVLAADLLESLR